VLNVWSAIRCCASPPLPISLTHVWLLYVVSFRNPGHTALARPLGTPSTPPHPSHDPTQLLPRYVLHPEWTSISHPYDTYTLSRTVYDKLHESLAPLTHFHLISFLVTFQSHVSISACSLSNETYYHYHYDTHRMDRVLVTL